MAAPTESPKAFHRALGLIVAGLLLAVGTPWYLAFADPAIRGYLFHPVLFAIQAAPYLLAALLWLPKRFRLSAASAQVLAALLFLSSVLFYIPMLVGLVPTGGDMIGLAFVAIAIGTGVGIVVITLVAYGVQWMRR